MNRPARSTAETWPPRSSGDRVGHLALHRRGGGAAGGAAGGVEAARARSAPPGAGGGRDRSRPGRAHRARSPASGRDCSAPGSGWCERSPPSGEMLLPGSVVTLRAGTAGDSGFVASAMPDVRGLSLRDALLRVRSAGGGVRAQGGGWVLSQFPDPGAPLEPGARCLLTLGPDSSRAYMEFLDSERRTSWAVAAGNPPLNPRGEPAPLPADRPVTGVAYDHRRVVPGSVFVCLRGQAHDGHEFAAAAAAAGACLVVGERARLAAPIDPVPYLRVDDARRALALLGCAFSRPSQPRARAHRRDRHQRQDLVHAPAARGAPSRRGSRRRFSAPWEAERRRKDLRRRGAGVLGRGRGRRRVRRCSLRWQAGSAHHARGARPAGRAAPVARRGHPGRRDGGLLPRAGAAPQLRDALRLRRLHQPHRGPSRLSRHHGGLPRGQGAALPPRRAWDRKSRRPCAVVNAR